jgi:GNAT superfamily N-acetyltransferase
VPARAPTYRHTALLCSLVVAGWIWDTVLGGARAHAVAWLAALLVVGGISALTVRSARRIGYVRSLQPVETEPDLAIRVAEPDDLRDLPEIERSAGTLFEVAGYGTLPEPATVEALEAALIVLVAGRPAIGYVRVDRYDQGPHIGQLCVRPKFMQRGVGTALVQAACAWARGKGYSSITLCAFADVDWNTPFFRRLGFAEIEVPSAALAQLRENEIAAGLDKLGRRIVMWRDLDTPVVDQG